MRLTEETAEPDTVEDLLTSGVRAPKDKAGVDVTKLSSRDIAKKRQELAKAKSKPTDDELAPARAVIAAQAGLRNSGLKASVGAKREDGEWVAVVSLPLDRLGSLVKAVTRAK